jgi:uncharacterized membrane protein
MKKEATLLIIVVAALALIFAAVRAANRTPAPAATPAARVDTAPATTAQEPTESSVRRIEPQELQNLLSRGEVTVIDVRDANSYLAAHVAGSMHIPLSRIESEIPYLPRGKPIVTYCT